MPTTCCVRSAAVPPRARPLPRASRRQPLLPARRASESDDPVKTTTDELAESERIKADRAPNEYDFTEVQRLADGGEMREGQMTAIITGVLSLAMGFGYIAVVSALDGRGTMLEPPPPEALGL